VALAGGTTPKRLYELLATKPFRNRVEWPPTHLFFGDERAVPPDHPDSNYAMVFESLISKVPLPPQNVHRIMGEETVTDSAAAYESELRTFFAGESWPRFDLVLLGVGQDGHTASLFPNADALIENSRWVVTTKQKDSGQDRITLTVPALNHARHVIFLVAGQNKAQAVKQVLHSQPGSERLPAQAIMPIDGTLEWLIDKDAASLM
jgi:6-phosphogluconolactonase